MLITPYLIIEKINFKKLLIIFQKINIKIIIIFEKNITN